MSERRKFQLRLESTDSVIACMGHRKRAVISV